MEIYSYHYGAAPGKGIGVLAQSRELENLPLGPFLKDLSSFRALASSGQRGEKLCCLLEKDGYTIFGLTYPEPPEDSGTAAPCGLLYVVRSDEWQSYAKYTGEIVRTAVFRKPETPVSEPAAAFPQDKNRPASGIRPDVMAQLVDGLVRAALSVQNEILVAALPGGLESGYETARSAIGEALDCLPPDLRKNIRFLTGLPVREGETKCLAGYENAVRLNANAVFCPHRYLRELTACRSFIWVDMEHPSGETGAFASWIVRSSHREEDLQRITARLQGAPEKRSYAELNQAAEELAGEKPFPESETRRRTAQAPDGSGKKGGRKPETIAGSRHPEVPEKEKMGLSVKILLAVALTALLTVSAFAVIHLLPADRTQGPAAVQASALPAGTDAGHQNPAVSGPDQVPAADSAEPPRNTWIPLVTVSPQKEEPISAPGIHNRYARTVTKDDPLRIREQPGTNARTAKSIPPDSLVWAVRSQPNDVNILWTEVYYQEANGPVYHGYAASEFLNLLSQEESDRYNAGQPSPVPQNMYGREPVPEETSPVPAA